VICLSLFVAFPKRMMRQLAIMVEQIDQLPPVPAQARILPQEFLDAIFGGWRHIITSWQS